MQNHQEMISIIMAAYNAENTIEAAIQSVICQTYKKWELLVVDDCSKDHTAQIVEKLVRTDPRIHLLKNTTNQGVSISRKIGLDYARGEWIAILDSDDMWAKDKLEKQLKTKKKKNADLIFTGSAFIKSDGQSIDWVLHVPESISYRELLKQNLISNSSVMVRSVLYRQHYAMGDEMHEDFAIWLGITRMGGRAFGIDEPLLIYRLSNSSKSGNKIKSLRMNWNTYCYLGLNPLKAAYYMCWYIVKGLLKYRHLR